MKFEDKLQYLRKKANLSQEQLADKLNVSRQAVSKWESGASYPEMDKLIAMSKIFKCSMDDLVNDDAKDFKSSKEKKTIDYLDSFLSFMHKSVDMFCSMKFSSLIKTVSELVLIAFFLSLGVFIINSLVEGIVYRIFSFLTYPLGDIVITVASSVVFIFLVVLAVMVFLEIYKIRYLDYYDKLIDEDKNGDDVLNEEKSDGERDKSEDKDKKRIDVKSSNRDHIIIRDPKERPLAFLRPLSNFIVTIIKIFVLGFSLFFVASLVFFVIALVISAFLLTQNIIFLGVILGLLGVIVINIQILYTVYVFIFNKRFSSGIMGITFLSAIVVASIGVGLFIIGLRNFEIIEVSDLKDEHISQTYNMTDDFYLSLDDGRIEFITDETVDEIVIDIDYSDEYYGIDFIEYTDNITIAFNYKYPSINEYINELLDDIRSNKLRVYDSFTLAPKITITSNSANISTLLKNISRHYKLNKTSRNNRIYVYIYDEVNDNSYCELGSDNLYDCYEVDKAYRCNYEFKDGNIIASDSCICNYLGNNQYYCQYDDEQVGSLD